jgi:hypothetical protein
VRLSDAPSECIHTLCNRASPSRDVGEHGIARMRRAECLESPARQRLPASSPTFPSCPRAQHNKNWDPNFLDFISVTSGSISPLPHRDAQCDRPRNGRDSVLVPPRASQTMHGRATASHASAGLQEGKHAIFTRRRRLHAGSDGTFPRVAMLQTNVRKTTLMTK